MFDSQEDNDNDDEERQEEQESDQVVDILFYRFAMVKEVPTPLYSSD